MSKKYTENLQTLVSALEASGGIATKAELIEATGLSARSIGGVILNSNRVGETGSITEKVEDADELTYKLTDNYQEVIENDFIPAE